MSIFIAIVQAILQSIAWIFPISESGHSSIYHDFAGSVESGGSALTGIIHIGIAVGIVFAMLNLFVMLTKQFVGTFKDIAKKNLRGSSDLKARNFMYMSLIAFVPMLLLFIPTGKGLLYTLLHSTAKNPTLLDDGLFIIALGGLVLVAARMVELNRNDKELSLLPAIVTGVLSIVFIPVSGLSLLAGTFVILMLFGVRRSLAFKFSFALSAPVLVVLGIVEICTAEIQTGWVEGILAAIISAVVSFFAVKFLRWVIKTKKLQYFGLYDIGIGVIASIIGAFELIFK